MVVDRTQREKQWYASGWWGGTETEGKQSQGGPWGND